MNVLIIEDDKVTLKTLQAGVENLGHKVYLAESGEEAIGLLENKKFDLLISDVMMPGISGLSLVNVLRTVNLCSTPIVMISSLNNKPLLEAAFKAGANDFITKPFSIKELSDILKKFDSDTHQIAGENQPNNSDLH